MTLRPRRVRRNVVIGASSAVAAWAIGSRVDPPALGFVLSVGSGWVGLGLIGATLVLGPLNVMRGRPNPVSTHLRRDLGIWAAVATLLHVVVGLQRHLGGDLLRYFFHAERGFPVPRLDPFGITNWLGGVGTVICLLLLALSNDRALRGLGTSRWKRLQRWNYALLPLVVVHGVVYQWTETRVWPWLPATLALGGLVLGVQLLGFRKRRAGA